MIFSLFVKISIVKRHFSRCDNLFAIFLDTLVMLLNFLEYKMRVSL